MKLSKDTLALIKNFSNINGSLILKSGKKLSTISEGKNVMAEASIQEEFPSEFGIYDVNEFLNVITLFQDTQLEFSEKYVMISDGGNSSVKYYAAGEGLIKSPPATIKFPSSDIIFELTEDQLAVILRSCSVLKSSDVSIVGDGQNLIIIVADKKNDTSNAYQLVIGKTENSFKANLKVENLKMLPGTYEVEISSKKIARFTNKNVDLKYYVAIEADSTFN